MTRRTITREIAVFLGLFLLTAIMTWPWILHIRDAVSDRGDSYAHAYWLWWGAYQTFHDPLNLFNATIFFPYKNTLAFSENDFGIALLFSPLFALGFRAVTVHSIATLTAFAFSGYGMFRLTRTLTGSRGAAWVSGIIFAFLPYRFQRLPHLPLIFAGWIPLTLEALVLFTRQRSWKRAIWLGVAFTMNALTCLTWFTLTLVPFGLSAVFLLVWCRVWGDRNFWIRAGLVFVVVALGLLCFMFPYYRVHQMYGFARSPGDAINLSAMPIHWLVVSPRNKLWQGLGVKWAVDELTLFPGFLPPLLVLAGVFLVKPLSREYLVTRWSKIQRFLRLRTVVIFLDAVALMSLLIALLTIGYGILHIRLFGFQLLNPVYPTRAFIFFLCIVTIRLLIARPEIIRRIIGEKSFFATLKTHPLAVAYLLGVIWAVTGFLGSLGMHFVFHRLLFEYVPLFKSMRAPVRWAMICYVGLSILAGLGAKQLVELLRRWRPRVPRTPVYALLCILVLFEQRVAPIEFVHGEVDPDALTLWLKATPMSGGIVELPAERGKYAYLRYMLRAADHGRPIVTASSSFAPPIVEEIESLTLMRPIPDRLITLLEEIPTSYLVVHHSLLSADSRRAIEVFLGRGLASGRINFIASYGDSRTPDDLYAITKTGTTAPTETANRIDEAHFFVRQQYVDLLNREPSQAESDKLAASINGCNGEPGCLVEQRILGVLDVVHSTEFQETSYLIYRLYKTAFGRMPKNLEWARDISRFNTKGKEGKLPFVKQWVTQAEFLELYPDELTSIQFVDKLVRISGQVLSKAEYETLIGALNNGKTTRADILIRAADDASVIKREYNEALVAICYFDFLQRDPDPGGYSYWLRRLSNKSNGEAAVITGFIYSGEYRARFGRP